MGCVEKNSLSKGGDSGVEEDIKDINRTLVETEEELSANEEPSDRRRKGLGMTPART